MAEEPRPQVRALEQPAEEALGVRVERGALPVEERGRRRAEPRRHAVVLEERGPAPDPGVVQRQRQQQVVHAPAEVEGQVAPLRVPRDEVAERAPRERRPPPHDGHGAQARRPQAAPQRRHRAPVEDDLRGDGREHGHVRDVVLDHVRQSLEDLPVHPRVVGRGVEELVEQRRARRRVEAALLQVRERVAVRERGAQAVRLEARVQNGPAPRVQQEHEPRDGRDLRRLELRALAPVDERDLPGPVEDEHVARVRVRVEETVEEQRRADGVDDAEQVPFDGGVALGRRRRRRGVSVVGARVGVVVRVRALALEPRPRRRRRRRRGLGRVGREGRARQELLDEDALGAEARHGRGDDDVAEAALPEERGRPFHVPHFQRKIELQRQIRLDLVEDRDDRRLHVELEDRVHLLAEDALVLEVHDEVPPDVVVDDLDGDVLEGLLALGPPRRGRLEDAAVDLADGRRGQGGLVQTQELAAVVRAEVARGGRVDGGPGPFSRVLEGELQMLLKGRGQQRPLGRGELRRLQVDGAEVVVHRADGGGRPLVLRVEHPVALDAVALVVVGVLLAQLVHRAHGHDVLGQDGREVAQDLQRALGVAEAVGDAREEDALAVDAEQPRHARRVARLHVVAQEHGLHHPDSRRGWWRGSPIREG